MKYLYPWYIDVDDFGSLFELHVTRCIIWILLYLFFGQLTEISCSIFSFFCLVFFFLSILFPSLFVFFFFFLRYDILGELDS